MSTAASGNKVKVHYTGTFDDGEVFDSSRESQPLEFEIGAGQVIPGFDQAIEGMAVGESKQIRLPEDPRLFAGMFARVAVPAGERARLLVPADAVTRIGQLEFVTVVEGGRTERRLVTTAGLTTDDLLEVLSGLNEGEKVAR